MKQRGSLAIVAYIMVCSQLGLGGENPRKVQQARSELAQAPPGAQSWRNPYAGQANALMAGKKLYARHCAQCHGLEGLGKEKAPNLRSATVQNASPGQMFWFLKNGNLKEGMPSWSRLPDQQLWQLVTYLQTLH